MTLVEVMVAMVVFAIVAASITSAALLMRRTAEYNVYMTTAHTVTQGYLEQIRNLNYSEIVSSANSVNEDTKIPLNLVSISAITEGDLEDNDDPILPGEWNQRDILIDLVDPYSDSSKSITMQYEVFPELTSLNTGADPLNAVEVTLRYRYALPMREDLIERAAHTVVVAED